MNTTVLDRSRFWSRESKYDLPKITKIPRNPINNDKNDVLSVPQDSFINEENNNIFNDTNNEKETAQIHTLVHTGLIQITADADDGSASSEGENKVA